jgi:hypothetical protein
MISDPWRGWMIKNQVSKAEQCTAAEFIAFLPGKAGAYKGPSFANFSEHSSS